MSDSATLGLRRRKGMNSSPSNRLYATKKCSLVEQRRGQVLQRTSSAFGSDEHDVQRVAIVSQSLIEDKFFGLPAGVSTTTLTPPEDPARGPMPLSLWMLMAMPHFATAAATSF